MKPKEFLLAYLSAYEQKYGRRYLVAWGRDMKTAKRLVEALGPEAQAALEIYFTLPSDFVVKAGHPLTLMQTVLPQIVAALRAREKEKQTLKVSPDALRLAEARKKLMGGGA